MSVELNESQPRGPTTEDRIHLRVNLLSKHHQRGDEQAEPCNGSTPCMCVPLRQRWRPPFRATHAYPQPHEKKTEEVVHRWSACAAIHRSRQEEQKQPARPEHHNCG